MDSPTGSEQESADNIAIQVPGKTIISNRPIIRNWDRQYLENNSGLVSQRNWESSMGGILNKDADEQSSEVKGRHLLQDRKFFQSMLQELNGTDWMFRSGASS
jgi:hypothetical protein